MQLRILLFLLGTTVFANAELVSIQFQGGGTAQTGAAAIGSAGDAWNRITYTGTSGSNIALVNSAGATTAVTLSYTTGYGIFSYTATSGYGAGQGLATGYLATFGTDTITLSGLTAFQAYTLYTYSERVLGVAANTGVSVNGGTMQTATEGPSNGYVLGQNYLIFQTTANATGQLNITYSKVVNEGNFNGLQLTTGTTATPEPGTLGLLGAGLLLLVGTARRHKLSLTRSGDDTVQRVWHREA